MQAGKEIFPSTLFLPAYTVSMLSDQKGPPPSLPSTPSLSASKPINDKFLYRFSTLLAVKILKRVRPRQGNVLMLTDRLCDKYGRRVHLAEASTMCFVSQHTSVPLPKALRAFTHSGWTYIVMERIRGDIIGSGWVRRSEVSKARLLSQLENMVREMRNLQPPEGMGARRRR